AGISQRLATIQLIVQLPAGVQNSSLELVEVIDVGRPIVAINSHDQRETNSCFGGGDGDRKNCDHYPGGLMWFRTEPPERDEIQVRGCKHHLDADQDENRMPPAERSEQPDAEKRRGYDEEDLECH